MKKRVLALCLALLLCMTLLPVAAGAEDDVALEDGAPVQHVDSDGEEIDPVDMPADESDEENEALDKNDEAEEKKDETEDKKDETADKKDETQNEDKVQDKGNAQEKLNLTSEEFLIQDGVLIKHTSSGSNSDVVIIPKGVTSIGDSAFRYHTHLKSVTIPDGVTSIGASAFWGCSELLKVTMPDSVTSIGKSAFFGCTHLHDITLSKNLTSIGTSAFESCRSLGSITIPDGVTSIGAYVFRDCNSLEDITIPNSVTSIGELAFSSCKALINITIPDSVTSIGRGAFRGCSLTDITIPNRVTSIETETFDNCYNLSSVTIPVSVTKIERRAFALCGMLRQVNYGGTKEQWKKIKIAYASVYTENGYLLKAAINYAGEPVMEEDKKSEEKEEEFVIKNGELIKYNGKDSKVVIPDGVTRIGSYAFDGCTWVSSVEIPGDLTSVGEYAFRNCKGIYEIYLGSELTELPRGLFYGCEALRFFRVGNKVTSIGEEAFYGCVSLSDLTIFESVNSIGKDAVSGCRHLRIYGYKNTYAAQYAMQNGITFSSAGLVPGSEPSIPAMIAYPSTQTVEVDGQKVEFQCYALKDGNGNDTNYIKLRDLADILNGSAAQFQVGWDGDVTIATKQSYTRNGSERSTPFSGQREYKKAAGRTLINGASKELAAFVLNDDNGGGYTYYQLRDLGKAIGFNVGWAAGKGIFVETDKPYDANN